MGSLNKKASGAHCFIMALGLFWDIVTGLPWTPNGVGSLEPKGYCVFLPGAHYLTINSPDGANSSLNKLLLWDPCWKFQHISPALKNYYHHHRLNVHFLPRLIKGMDGCFPTALGRQSTFSNISGPLVSHSDASISRKSRLVAILKRKYFSLFRKFPFPGKVGASFWWWYNFYNKTTEWLQLTASCCICMMSLLFVRRHWCVRGCILPPKKQGGWGCTRHLSMNLCLGCLGSSEGVG